MHDNGTQQLQFVLLLALQACSMLIVCSVDRDTHQAAVHCFCLGAAVGCWVLQDVSGGSASHKMLAGGLAWDRPLVRLHMHLHVSAYAWQRLGAIEN